jgi:hypothetical protein
MRNRVRSEVPFTLPIGTEWPVMQIASSKEKHKVGNAAYYPIRV